MSTESMIRDVELAEEALPKKAGGPQSSRRCLCLSLFSFLLVAGATALFCLLHFGVIGPQREEVSASPALAPSATQRQMGEEEGEGWGGNIGERQGGRKRSGERSGKREGWKERVPVTWKVCTKHLLNE